MSQSIDESVEKKTGQPAPVIRDTRSAEQKIEQREKDALHRAKRERNVEGDEQQAQEEADQEIEGHINEDILDRTRGLRKRPAGLGVQPRPPEYFLQAEEQKGLQNDFTSHVLGTDYNEHVENLSRGRVRSFAPIPLPPVNQYNMFPQNQFPVDSTIQLDVSTIERQKWQPMNISSSDMAPLLQPDPARQPLEMFNIPEIQKRVFTGVETAEQVAATPEFSEIIHPLNKRFTLSDDPYNQNGKQFRQQLGYEQGDARIDTSHITGGRRDVESDTKRHHEQTTQRTNEDRMADERQEDIDNVRDWANQDQQGPRQFNDNMHVTA